jgi:hypothetical protein
MFEYEEVNSRKAGDKTRDYNWQPYFEKWKVKQTWRGRRGNGVIF